MAASTSSTTSSPTRAMASTGRPASSPVPGTSRSTPWRRRLDLGAKVVTLSDSGGFIHDPDGIDSEKMAFVKELKEVRRGRIAQYAERFGCAYHEGASPWEGPL